MGAKVAKVTKVTISSHPTRKDGPLLFFCKPYLIHVT